MPTKEAKEKSPREIVHLIVKRYLDDLINDHQFENEIEQALRDRDERAAKIAEAWPCSCAKESRCERLAGREIASAIRGKS